MEAKEESKENVTENDTVKTTNEQKNVLEMKLVPTENISTVEKIPEEEPAPEEIMPEFPVIDNKEIAEDELEKTTMKAIMNNQDNQQKIMMAITFLFELYRVIMSTLLVLFVPQQCDEGPCSVSDKTSPQDQFEAFTLVFNFITFSSFLVMYILESKRELHLINYLDINRFKPRDNESVGNELDNLSLKRRNRIEVSELNYQYSSYLNMVLFLLNSLFSAIVVFNSFLDSKTITVFLTNILFMTSKLYDVYNTVNTKPYVFLSAYLTRKIQYNDIDPDKREKNKV